MSTCDHLYVAVMHLSNRFSGNKGNGAACKIWYIDTTRPRGDVHVPRNETGS